MMKFSKLNFSILTLIKRKVLHWTKWSTIYAIISQNIKN